MIGTIRNNCQQFDKLEAMKVTSTSRTYTLSPAALAQRRANAAKLRAVSVMAGVDAESPTSEIVRMFPQLPKGAPNSEHQRRTALIRVHLIKTGVISGRAVGGRRKIQTSCQRCGTPCESARDAWLHCSVPRK